MEKQRLVHLLPVPENRKEKQVVLTEEGKRYADERIRPFIRVEQEIFVEMGEEDSEEYLRLMQKYIAIYRQFVERVLQIMKPEP